MLVAKIEPYTETHTTKIRLFVYNSIKIIQIRCFHIYVKT